MAIAWSDSFATGVAEMDRQHRELLEHIGRLPALVRSDPAAVGRTLDFLGEYAGSHFAVEERLMEAHAFPGAAAHREAHRAFVSDFSRLRYDHDVRGVTEGLPERIGDWMADWLGNHILSMDQALARHVLGHGPTEPTPLTGTWVVPSGRDLRVLSLTPGRALERAGVQAGDLILAVGGKRIADLGVQAAVAALADPGPDGLTITVHPRGDVDRVETRFVARRAAPARG
jgi:hemerythrin-like metal-binding protein